VAEARLRETDDGLVPEGDGWFVLNARDARWFHSGTLGSATSFEGEERFPELGINVNVMQPGQPSAMYHAEGTQEGFLVLAGEGLLIVEGEERPLRAWDFFHCPADVPHVLVGAGEGPFVFVAVGARREGASLVYPADEAARRHGAGAGAETSSPKEAYAGHEIGRGRYREGDLPD
jgi:uncharacterized cupin superfamily protein